MSLSVILVFALLAALSIPTSNAFLMGSQGTRRWSFAQERNNNQRLYVIEDVPLFGEESVSVAAEESKSLFESLRERQEALDNGIGKRYVCRTQKGFLNVHKEPGDPFNTVNIVDQLQEGDIVTSVGPPRGVGAWIPHDHGGWSVTMYNGFKFLEPLDE